MWHQRGLSLFVFLLLTSHGIACKSRDGEQTIMCTQTLDIYTHTLTQETVWGRWCMLVFPVCKPLPVHPRNPRCDHPALTLITTACCLFLCLVLSFPGYQGQHGKPGRVHDQSTPVSNGSETRIRDRWKPDFGTRYGRRSPHSHDSHEERKRSVALDQVSSRRGRRRWWPFLLCRHCFPIRWLTTI